MKNYFFFIFLFFSVVSFAQKPVNLQCEYLETPLGIDCESPRLSWQLEDEKQGVFQKSYQLIVDTDSINVANGIGSIWDTEKVLSDQMLVCYKGKDLKAFQKYYWRVKVTDKNAMEHLSDISFFETGMRGLHHWKGVWISDGHDTNGQTIKDKPAPYFRTSFEIKKDIAFARAYIAVGGLYELSINGEQVGDHRLDPMFTRYDRRNLYVTYDVTSQLSKGKNAIGVLLGNGWYNHQPIAVWYFDRAPWRNRPVFCMDLRITYTDGTVETIVSDRKWKTSLSPIVFNSIYVGEHYDSRIEQKGWNTPNFDDSKWGQVQVRPAPSQNIVSQQLHPIKNVEEIKPISLTKIKEENTYCVDFGCILAGVTQLKLKGEKGTKVYVKHAELLDEKGRLDMSNIDLYYTPENENYPFQTDLYILNGDENLLMPHFNYKGFRYVEITSDKPLIIKKEDITAWFMHSDVPEKGSFHTSNSLINNLWNATNRSYLSNLFGYPTDCPQREKNGWTGDANIAIETGLYNFDGITIYEKWLADHQDEQQPNGTLPAIIPTSGWGYQWGNGLDWTSTIAIIPWNIYMFYGDSRLLESCYENIKRYVDHVTDLYPSGLTSWGLGDWVPVKSKTPVEFGASIYYYVDTKILAEAAKILNKPTDYKKYSSLAERIKETFNRKYLDREKAIYGDGVQTQLSMPLYWGLVPEDLQKRVAFNLAERVKADNSHVDVGILGAKAILNALSDNGYADLAYTVASQKTYPSWGFWIANGATSLHENWKQGETDLSLNHIMFGEISAWFYKTLAGIKPDPKEPGFKHILLQPKFVLGLENVSASYLSPYGKIVSKWERKGKKVFYYIEIPPNSKASFGLPKGYKLKKIIHLSQEDYKPKEEANRTYLLSSGSYQCELEK